MLLAEEKDDSKQKSGAAGHPRCLPLLGSSPIVVLRNAGEDPVARHRTARRRIVSMALKRAVEISQGRGLAGIPVSCQQVKAPEKASCMESSARSRSPSRRTRVARILPASARYSKSSDRRTCSGAYSGMQSNVANRLRSGQSSCAKTYPVYCAVFPGHSGLRTLASRGPDKPVFIDTKSPSRSSQTRSVTRCRHVGPCALALSTLGLRATGENPIGEALTAQEGIA